MNSDAFIFGLGNPGQEYSFSRHNFGFIALDSFSKENYFPAFSHKKNYLISNKTISDKNIYLIKPLTYMNLSGKAVKEALNKHGVFKISDNNGASNIILIHDDLDLAFGSYKIKLGGSGGSHNGVNSVINSLQSKNFIRVKLGINSPDRARFSAGADYVLSNFSKEEIKKIPGILKIINEILLVIISDGLTKAMNTFSRK
ncbi:MAG: aminoacyl-tRNA hydrolase [Deltaproteobacteria bacterium]|jgi:PTH1 family peptidyl-tRNA hydrolase|nr:aminoacyl-tRNA hydrolase [Deltaproteobacteria bacterium]MCL5879459.1 aminoacyl-tRNA hydrolase [Deltaproteobacteria bacterium]MDA8304473.1 aminoacyl-tRNA hydrolase [Deltaproteobacteria bacterium]